MFRTLQYIKIICKMSCKLLPLWGRKSNTLCSLFTRHLDLFIVMKKQLSFAVAVGKLWSSVVLSCSISPREGRAVQYWMCSTECTTFYAFGTTRRPHNLWYCPSSSTRVYPFRTDVTSECAHDIGYESGTWGQRAALSDHEDNTLLCCIWKIA